MTRANNKKREAAAAKARKALRVKHASLVCAEIESHRGLNGRIPRGIIQKVFTEHKHVYTWLTIDVVKKGLEKSKKNEVVLTETAISDLSNPTFDSQDSNEPAAVPPAIIQEQELPPELPLETSKPKGGRPRGTTMKALREKEAKKEALINDIATTWSAKVEEEKSEGEKVRMKRNGLDDLINQKVKESGLTGVKVSKKAIQQRVYRSRLVVAPHRGAQSPLKPIEAYIISMLNQMAKMRQPLSVSEGLALANALIEGTEWEQRLRDFKTKRGWQQLDEEGKMKPLLGKKWYRGFFKRNFRTRRIQVVSGSAEIARQLQEEEDRFVAATEDSSGSPE